MMWPLELALATHYDVQTSEHTQANKEKAISYAAYRALVDLFHGQVAYFNTLMNHLGYNPSDTSTAAAHLPGWVMWRHWLF